MNPLLYRALAPLERWIPQRRSAGDAATEDPSPAGPTDPRHRAVVIGPAKLYGQDVSSPDIRAGMALLLAALVAEGQTTIHNAQQVDRGYERIDERLRALGAHVERFDPSSG